MILPDVNVLIHAFRPGTSEHARCRRWLQGVVDADTAFGMSPQCLSAVVRITTNRRIWNPATSLGDAFRFCDYLLGQAHCQIVEPREGHWMIFKQLCLETDTRGPLATDAWYAALAIEWSCEWVTLDRDYARFPGLRWRLPDAA